MTALVLSGGGMFGAWQAGVWEALEKVFTPDLVIGASIGSLNGWAIASGVPGSELGRLWREPTVPFELRWRPPWRFREGLADPSVLVPAAEELCARYRPRVRYALVLAEVPGYRRRIVTSEDGITPDHLVAACSMPLVFPPRRLPDGSRCLDGGIFGALPLWAAAELGAEQVVAVNVMTDLPPVYRTVMHGVRRLVTAPRRSASARLPAVVIQPARRLGRLGDALKWKPENIARWLADGRRAGEEAAPRVSRFLSKQAETSLP